MAEKRDYYEILGVPKDAEDSAIKKAYRGLAMKYHPDRNPGDPQAVEHMKEINEAFAVLSDREKRRLYDTYGHRGLEGFSQEDIFRGVDFSSIFEEIFGGSGFGSIFDTLFGRPSGPRRRSGESRRQRRGADLRYDLEVTLEEAALGAEKKFEFTIGERCAVCEGQGAKPEDIQVCPDCSGSGQRVTEKRSAFGIFRQSSPCPTCRGQGKKITQPCEGCKGRGIIEKSKELSVQIPKGADTGFGIKISGRFICQD